MGNGSSTSAEKDTSMSPKTPKVTASPDGKGGTSTGQGTVGKTDNKGGIT